MATSSMRRFAQLFFAIALVGLPLTVIGAAPAAAFKTKTVTVSRDKAVTEKLGPIPGNYPAGTAAVPEPLDCGDDDDTAPFEAACDLVPLKIVVPPDLGPTDDFLLTLTVTWEPTDRVDESQGVNDLDVYLYDNTQIAKRMNPKSTAYTQLAVAAGSTQPEVIKLFSPDLGDYNLVVINFAGPNLSYTVKGEIKVEGFSSPFEDLGPTFAPRTRTTAAREDRNESFVAPVDRSGDDPPSSGGSSFGGGRNAQAPDLTDVGTILSGGRSLDEVPILPDTDFARIDPSASDNAFAAPTLPEGAGRTRAIAAAGPVSGILVAFWLVLVPLVVLGGGVFLLIRRSRNAFSFA